MVTISKTTARRVVVKQMKAAAEKYKLYSVVELQAILGLSHTTVYNYVKNGKIKARKIGREWKVTEKALDEFINGRDNDNNSDNGEK